MTTQTNSVIPGDMLAFRTSFGYTVPDEFVGTGKLDRLPFAVGRGGIPAEEVGRGALCMLRVERVVLGVRNLIRLAIRGVWRFVLLVMEVTFSEGWLTTRLGGGVKVKVCGAGGHGDLDLGWLRRVEVAIWRSSAYFVVWFIVVVRFDWPSPLAVDDLGARVWVGVAPSEDGLSGVVRPRWLVGAAEGGQIEVRGGAGVDESKEEGSQGQHRQWGNELHLGTKIA